MLIAFQKPTESYAYYQRATAKVLIFKCFGSCFYTLFHFVLGKDTREIIEYDVVLISNWAKDITS